MDVYQLITATAATAITLLAGYSVWTKVIPSQPILDDEYELDSDVDSDQIKQYGKNKRRDGKQKQAKDKDQKKKSNKLKKDQLEKNKDNSDEIGDNQITKLTESVHDSIDSDISEKNHVFKSLKFNRGENEYPMGIVNKGNTCFMNSVLQGLSSLDTLLQFLEDHEKTKYKIDNAKRKARERQLAFERENSANKVDEFDDDSYSDSQESSSNMELPLGKTRNQTKLMYKKEAEKYRENQRLSLGSRIYNYLSSRFFQFLRIQPSDKISMCVVLATMVENINNPGPIGRSTRADIMFNALNHADGGNRLTRYEQEDAHELYTIISSSLTNEELVVPEFDEGKDMVELLKSFSTSSLDLNFGNNNDGIVPIEHNNEFVDKQEKLSLVPSTSNRSSKGVYPPRLDTIPLVIRNPMSGLMATLLKCNFCGYTPPITLHRFDHLSLSVPYSNKYKAYNGIYIEKLLSEFLQPELVDEWKCANCWKTRFIDKMSIIISAKEKIIEILKSKIKAKGGNIKTISENLDEKSLKEKDNQLLKSNESDNKNITSINSRKNKKKKVKKSNNNQPIENDKEDQEDLSSLKNKFIKFIKELNESKQLLELGKVNYPSDLSIENEENINLRNKLFNIQHPVLQKVIKQADIAKYPSCLVLHIQRTTFMYDRMVKNRTPVYIEKYLYVPTTNQEIKSNDTINNATIFKPDEDYNNNNKNVLNDMKTQTVYKLKAIIYHHGDHGYGHYVCCREWKEDEWLLISDSSVHKIKGGFEDVSKGIIGGDIYMLFYELVNNNNINEKTTIDSNKILSSI